MVVKGIFDTLSKRLQKKRSFVKFEKLCIFLDTYLKLGVSIMEITLKKA